MPWVQVFLPKPGSLNEYDLTKSEIAKILLEELQKPEQGLTVMFQSPLAYYRAGVPVTDAAVVDVRYIGSFPLAKKQAVTKRIALFLAETFKLDPLKVTVEFSEVVGENWGRKAGDFS